MSFSLEEEEKEKKTQLICHIDSQSELEDSHVLLSAGFITLLRNESR